jgi:hypothetical protein
MSSTSFQFRVSRKRSAAFKVQGTKETLKTHWTWCMVCLQISETAANSANSAIANPTFCRFGIDCGGGWAGMGVFGNYHQPIIEHLIYAVKVFVLEDSNVCRSGNLVDRRAIARLWDRQAAHPHGFDDGISGDQHLL